jgi:hypothetical protein
MSATPPKSVKETGARADDLLVGITPRNMGLVVRIYNGQEPGEGGRIVGAFEIIHWGEGTYSMDLLQASRQQSGYGSVGELIDVLSAETGKTDFTHGLNANGLWRLDAQTIADQIIGPTRDEKLVAN